ncbi:hypothetical protein DUNSADRAFT_12279 [Dunaliella salina]|uniref:Uncharacterized protein n=1 Tax=Dunaliella salina TaxID=3046 RepID=A0ABQ7H400_DUNSA|nr:hypothetical protein DUNSADRAFT_12279 [Dunaliella salina]KAF5841581.1 hypothetical protein DUNSADRAFT_12279 [Dunaliella salina]|eukprot:KAF5841580.1 hypothetical protein DUNSADRAFT_12279 [Dunaliella salina]
MDPTLLYCRVSQAAGAEMIAARTAQPEQVEVEGEGGCCYIKCFSRAVVRERDAAGGITVESVEVASLSSTVILSLRRMRESP